MNSAIVEYLDKLDNQWKEIDRLSELAKKISMTLICITHYAEQPRFYVCLT